jgi:amino acid transporter
MDQSQQGEQATGSGEVESGETPSTSATPDDGASRPTGDGSSAPAGDTQRRHTVRIVSESSDTPPPTRRAEPSAETVQEGGVEPAASTTTIRSRDEQASQSVPERDVRQPTSTPHRVTPDLRKQEVVKGTHPGDRYVRYGRNAGPFRRRGSGVLAASLATEAPRSRVGRFFGSLKRVLIGTPISTEHSIHERLTNVKALAVLSSDALSSVAYATEEILRILILAGVGALSWAMPLGFAVILLMVIVVASYRQTIAAYPRGGGTYIVAKDNLGALPGLAAAASILIGYILTVAVSVAAGIAAVYSLVPEVRPYRVELCLIVVVFVTVANLRGLREAGNIFAVPTYLFILAMVGLIVYGLARIFLGVGGEMQYIPPDEEFLTNTAEAVSLLLLMRAFTQGAAALTGVEAIADGVPAFKPPEAVNARKTLLYMAVISIFMFAGITFLATQLHILPSEQETVVSQIARTVFGKNIFWIVIQIATALILVLAANTAFADFPRLGYFLARDKYMPHQYSFRGDRLAFSWGIITLAALACALIVAFDGDTSALIPLYAIGVMAAFTFSQSGMVVRWWKLRPQGWWRNMIMNGIGAATTLMVFLVATITKLDQGTWLVILLIPVQMAIFLAIHRHYRRVESEVAALDLPRQRIFKHTFIVPVSSLNSVALSALDYARSLSANVTAVHIVEGEEPEEAEHFNTQWREEMGDTDINLVIIESPYRSLIGPLLSYVDALDQQSSDDTITIVLPEFLPAKPWEYLLHNQSALRLKAALLFRPNTVVADVPYHLGRLSAQGDRAGQTLFAAIPWAAVVLIVLTLVLIYWFFIGF